MAVRDDLSDVNDGRYSNILLLLALGVLLYILIRGWSKAKQQTYSDAIGSDQNLLLAQQLRQAFIPSGFPVAMGFDGTDTATVMAVAAQITDYEAVARAYRTLYNADLSNDLSEELGVGDLSKFWSLVNSGNKSKPTTGTTTTTKPATTTGTSATVAIGRETSVVSLAGKTCVATEAVNIRLYKEPQYAVNSAAKGDKVGKYAGEADIKINGKTGRFVHIKKAAVVN